jgi:hypothetical protein
MRRRSTTGIEDTSRTRWRDGVSAALLTVALVVTGCATTSDRQGRVGAVDWEIRWDAPVGLVRRYTVILTETAGQRIELDYVESRAEGLRFAPDGPTTVRTAAARRYLGETLAPRGARRIEFEFPVLVGGALVVSEVRHEFHGRIDGTQPIRVDVRVRKPRQ